MSLSRDIKDQLQRLRETNSRAEVERSLEEEMAADAVLADEKQLAIIAIHTALLEIAKDADDQEALNVIATIAPDLFNSSEPHRVAVYAAYARITLHLIRQLARARGETFMAAWRREATELVRKVEQGD